MITYDLVEATENSNELVDNINFKKTVNAQFPNSTA